METLLTDKLKDFLEQEGYKLIKEVPGRGICGIEEFMFTVGICYGLNQIGRDGRYCYPKDKAVEAILAYQIWDGVGDPVGPWIKYKGIGRERSNPNLPEE